MKTFIFKIIIFLAMSFLCVFFILKIISRISTKYETFILNNSEIELQSDAIGIIYKDESVLNLGNEKIIKNIYKDGTKIRIDSKVAQIFDTKEDALKYEKICELEEKLEDLTKINEKKFNNNIDLININRGINISYEKFLECLNKKDMLNITEEKRKLVNFLNTKEILTNSETKIKTTISKIENEINNIKNTINMPTNIISKHSGYFVGSTDGFEEKCSIDAADDLKIDEFKKFIKKIDNKKQTNNKNIKIITSPKILYKAIVPTKDLVNKKIGDMCKIKFEKIGQNISAYINDIIMKYDEKEGMIIFDIFDMTDTLSNLRKSKSKIIFQKIYGFKIPKEAIKINEKNEIGVYVFYIDKMRFKPVDILFEDEHFVICKNKSKENVDPSKYLKNFDRIILKGRNLYDGKRT